MERQGAVHEGEGEDRAGPEGSNKERGGRALPLAGTAAALVAQAPSPPLPFPTPVAAPAPVPYLDPHTIASIFTNDGDDGVHGQDALTFDVSLGWGDDAAASYTLDA